MVPMTPPSLINISAQEAMDAALCTTYHVCNFSALGVKVHGVVLTAKKTSNILVTHEDRQQNSEKSVDTDKCRSRTPKPVIEVFVREMHEES